MAAKAKAFEIGIGEVDAALRDFDMRTQTALGRTATRTIGKKIQTDAKRLAPHNTGRRRKEGRHVRDALVVRTVARGKGRGARARRGQVGASVRVGEGFFVGKTFYAGYLEFGTQSRYTKDAQYRGALRQRAQGRGVHEFLRPALYSNREYAKTQFASAVREAIAARRLRLARKAAA